MCFIYFQASSYKQTLDAVLLWSECAMTPHKIKVRAYFTKEPDGAICNLCKTKCISKGRKISNLATHLRRIHKKDCMPHPSVAGIKVNYRNIAKQIIFLLVFV